MLLKIKGYVCLEEMHLLGKNGFFFGLFLEGSAQRQCRLKGDITSGRCVCLEMIVCLGCASSYERSPTSGPISGPGSTVLDTNLLSSQHCFFLPVPPNLTISLQDLHFPQSGC